MSPSTCRLTLELLAWIASRPRTYAETMDVWRSSCPRHPVWDDALVDGLVCVESGAAMDVAQVILTPRGAATLGAQERQGVGA